MGTPEHNTPILCDTQIHQQSAVHNTMWCLLDTPILLTQYNSVWSSLQAHLRYIHPNPKSPPHIHWCKGKNVSYLYYIDQARFKHHAAIDYPSSAWFFLSSFREKFRCHARLPGYQGKGLIASSPYSLLTFATNLWKIH